MNIIKYIQGLNVKRYDHKSTMINLVNYILSEKNYYKILHDNKIRNFGSYTYILDMSDDDKSEQLSFMMNNYCRLYHIFYVRINKNIVIIKFRINDIDYVLEKSLDNNKYYKYYEGV